MKQTCRGLSSAALLSAGLMASAGAMANEPKPAPLVIQEQGSFAVGGTMTQSPGTFDPYKPTAPAGQTFRGDHAYAFYQLPVNARKLPLVLWHGAGQFSKTWETTAGRARRISEHLSAPRVRGLRHRSAAARRRGPQHGPEHDHTDARRTALVRHVPDRAVAELFSRRAVREGPGDAQSILPLDDAQHRAVRCSRHHRCGFRAVRQDRSGDSGDPFAERWPGLDNSDEEPTGPRDRRLRARQRFRLSRRRGARADAERDGPA